MRTEISEKVQFERELALKFQVFQDGKPARDFVLSGAYMFGADLIPLYQVQMECREGVVDCQKKSPDSAGLALLWTGEGAGRLLLLTTRLPEREEPYNPNVELAPARRMQSTLKREDWALFEEDTKFADLAHEAQDLFIQALQHISDPAKASVLADQSLEKGLLFSEQLASRYAEQFLAMRCRHRGLGRHSMGCVIDLKRIEEQAYRKWLLEIFGFVTIPLEWGQIETEKGRYDFDRMDRCMDLLAGRRLALSAGPLLRFTPSSVPRWLQEKTPEFEKIREAAYEFVTRAVTRYAKYIHAWRVICGMHAWNCFGFTFDQIIEMTRTACLAAKSADTKSRKIVEIALPWGEYYAGDLSTIPPLVYADMVIQSGINFDAFGLQLHFGRDIPGMHIRDMMQISSRLDCFAPVAKPLHITSVGIPDRVNKTQNNPDTCGYWHKPWTQEVQSHWIESLYKAALSRSFINTVTYGALADGAEDEIVGMGLLDEKLAPKKALATVAKFQKLIDKR